ncbi:MAG: hypothetical protein JRN20_05935 [Nitrososphaerota archaeon]|nr:hypothetical protein [Nitrososphaerota archaeon]
MNSREYAIACEEAGADSVLFHLNQDSGGGVRFAGLEIEEDAIKDSLSVLKIPSGISIGDTRGLLYEDWEAITRLGFSFVNMYAHQLPTFVWEDRRFEKIISIGPGYILEQVKALSEFESVSAIVASLTPNQGIGLPFTMLDGTTLKLIARLSSKPVYVPTQRGIRPSDVKLLEDLGCDGLLISNTVYGENIESCKSNIRRFREEVSSMSQSSTP